MLKREYKTNAADFAVSSFSQNFPKYCLLPFTKLVRIDMNIKNAGGGSCLQYNKLVAGALICFEEHNIVGKKRVKLDEINSRSILLLLREYRTVFGVGTLINSKNFYATIFLLRVAVY